MATGKAVWLDERLMEIVLAALIVAALLAYVISKLSFRMELQFNEPAARTVPYSPTLIIIEGRAARAIPPTLELQGPTTNLGHGPVATHSWFVSNPVKTPLALPVAKLSDRIKAAHPDHGGSREQLEKVLEEKRIKG